MFGLKRLHRDLRSLIRKEIAREAQANMVSYTSARQSLDIYEMRLETLDTRLGKRVRELEAKVETLEASLTHYAEPQRRAG